MRMYETIVTGLKSVGTDAASGEPDERAATALLSFNQRRKIHIHVPENLRLEDHSIDCRDIQLDALDPAEIARPAAATADELRLVECDPIRSNHRRPVAPLPRADRDPTTFVRRIHPLVNILTTFFAWGVPVHEIFISYSRRDLATVQTLTTALSQQGVTVWVDKSDIQEGDAYDTQIEEAIAQTNVVIVLWSEHSVKSHWVRAEAAYALAKHKLLPISIDRSQPPLQFMQIQTLDFCSWQGSCEDEAFERLLVDLARRLNRQFSVSRPVAGAAIPPTAPGIATVAKADAGHNWITGAFAAGMVAVGLRFPEKIIENEFQDYFCNRMYAIAQFGMLLAFIAYVVYGVSDLASDAAISSTRFRYMVASPLLLLLYFMSFKEFAKKHSQLYISLFAVTLGICLYITVRLLGIETPFRIETGNATMNFMLVLGLLALLPLSVVSTALIGTVITGLHALIMIETQVPLATSWLSYLHVISMWTIACCIAYWREYQQRRSFAAELT